MIDQNVQWEFLSSYKIDLNVYHWFSLIIMGALNLHKSQWERHTNKITQEFDYKIGIISFILIPKFNDIDNELCSGRKPENLSLHVNSEIGNLGYFMVH